MLTLILLAQAVPPTEPVDLAKALFAAIMSGHWFLAASLVLMGIVFLIRRTPWPPLQTDVGGVLLNFGSSLALALFSAAAAGAPVTWPVILTALQVSGGAAVAYMLIKKFLLPILLKVPFLAKLWDLAAAAFSRGDAAAAVTAAEKQGLAAAVVAKSSTSDDIANR